VNRVEISEEMQRARADFHEIIEAAEHDMEQQLPVRPTSAVGAAPQVLSRRS
jgi:hypothetical protein